MRANRTLELYWKTMRACGIDDIRAEEMLREIERKHGIRTADLEKNLLKNELESNKNFKKLSNELFSFLINLKQNGQLKKFAKFARMGDGTLYRAIRTGYIGTKTYKKVDLAMKKWLK